MLVLSVGVCLECVWSVSGSSASSPLTPHEHTRTAGAGGSGACGSVTEVRPRGGVCRAWVWAWA